MNAHPTIMVTEARVLDLLRHVIDPEIGCNIVDLGMIYDIQIHGGQVIVRMTLTTQGCPMHESIVGGVQSILLDDPSVESADVELVWDPPWNPSMMSEAGRTHVGL